jgi:hypothetical protein
MSEWKSQLTQDLFRGKVILILGQSYLKWSSDRTLDDLVDPLLALLNIQLGKDIKAQGLRVVCRELIEERGIASGKVVNVLHRACRSLPISESLRLLSNAPWRAIFTTAVDDVLSRALNEIDNRFVRPVYDRQVQFTNTRGSNSLYVMYLQGSVDQISEDRVPAFTEEDEDVRASTTRYLLDNLIEFAGVDGVVVIAGFDPVIEGNDFCYELWQRIKELPRKQCYWFDPPKNMPDDSRLRRLINNQIIYPVPDIKFETFLDEIESESQQSHRLTSSERVVLTPEGEVTIPPSDWRFYKPHFTVLDQTAVRAETIKDPSERAERFHKFLEGNIPPDWSAIASGFAFRRPVIERLKSGSLKQLRTGRAKNNKIFTVSGPAGCGKTVILEQLAWELASEGHPVIYIPKRAFEPDFRVIEAFCRAVQPRSAKRGSEAGVRVVIVWDSLSAQASRYESLASFLASLGQPALVIGTTYAPPSGITINYESYEIEQGEVLERERIEDFPVPMGLSENEADPFFRHLEKEDPWLVQHLDKKKFLDMLQEYFLVALYDFVMDARERVRQGAALEYDYYNAILTPKLNAFFKVAEKRWDKLLPIVFVSSQYQIYPNIELVLHSLGNKYLNYWIEEKPQLPLEGLIEEITDDGVLRLKARHPRVAQMVVKDRCSYNDQLDVLRRLAMAVNPSNADELEFLRKLFFVLRQGTSAHSLRQTSSASFDVNFVNRHLEELIEILENFRENRLADFSLMHTEGLFQKRYADNSKSLSYKERFSLFSDAIDILQDALKELETEGIHEHRKAERQNVAGTLASIYSDLISLQLEFIKDHPEEDSPTIRQQISTHQLQLETYCNLGTVGARPNPYVPHIRVMALFKQFRMDKKLTESQRNDIRVEMLEELERAVQNFPETNLKPYLELRALVEEACGDQVSLEKTIQRLEKTERLSGYYMKARFTGYKYDSAEGRLLPKGDDALRSAISILKDEIDHPLLMHNAPCLALLGRLWWDLYGKKDFREDRDVVVGLSQDKWVEYGQILHQQLYTEGIRGQSNLRTMFMLAWALFQQEAFDEAKKVFREVDRMSLGSRLRTASLVRMSNEDGTPRQFKGEVGEPRDELHWLLYCPELRLTLPFQRFSLGRTLQKGDPVDFEIRLNYSGLMAVKPLPPKTSTVVKALHKKS